MKPTRFCGIRLAKKARIPRENGGSKRDSSLISTSVRMVHPQRTSDEKRPGRGRQRINPREFTTTGPRTRETAANYLLHRDLRQDGGGDQRGVSFSRWQHQDADQSRKRTARGTSGAISRKPPEPRTTPAATGRNPEISILDNDASR